MQKIPWQRWLKTFIVLIALAVAVDYYFMHIMFDQKKLAEAQNSETSPNLQVAASPKTLTATSALPADAPSDKTVPTEVKADNFLKSLQDCRADISAQGVTTPEALLTYLEKSIGTVSEIREVENYNIRLPDGSERRIHLIPADNTNSTQNRIELRYFKLDAEGYPERIPLNRDQSFDPKPEFLNSLISQGAMKLHQIRSIGKLKDNSTLSLDLRNDRVYEFQLRGEQKTLSCRELSCQCQ